MSGAMHRRYSPGASGCKVSSAPELRRDSFRSTLLQVKAGADDGIRTRDLRFTKPLLYQLSYVGRRGQTLHRGNGVAITLRGLVPSHARAYAHDRDC